MNVYKYKRQNEDKIALNRNERFYCMNDEWFFAIRRGPDQGPYPSRDVAQAALKKFIAEELAIERRLEAELRLKRILLKQGYRPKT